jgi:membrane protease YdiL (CAAX protease family)
MSPPGQIDRRVAIEEIEWPQLEAVPHHGHHGPIFRAHHVMHPDAEVRRSASSGAGTAASGFTMLHKVVIFYVLAFVFTIVLAGLQEGASISPEAVVLPQWGSGLAALVMLVMFRRDRHRFSVVDRNIPRSRYVAAALIPLGGALAAYLIKTLILGAFPFGDTAPTPWLLPLGAFGEELGWRGYLHKRLNIRLTGLPSSFIVGIMWAL